MADEPKRGTAIALAATLLAATPALAADPPSITVRGQCTVSALPDRARVEITAERRGPDAARAIADATTTYNKLRADVEALKLPDANLDSSGVQVGRLDDQDQARKTPTAFSATAGLTVETSSLQGLAQVMRVAATDKIDEIGPLETYLSDALHDRLTTDCLPKATADAKRQAEALLHGIDAPLGPVLHIDSVDTGGPVMRPMAAKAPGMMRAAMAQQTADLSAGPQVVTVSVMVTFGIGGGK